MVVLMIADAEQGSTARRRILVVRHGDVQYFDPAGQPLNPRDVSLTPLGRQQVAALKGMMDSVPIDRAVCSGMPRTQETAEILIQGRGLALEDEPAFREIRAGRFRELPPLTEQAMIAGAYDSASVPDGRFIGGELIAAFADRVIAAFERIIADPSWNSLLVVAHDAVNRTLLCHALGCGLGAMASLEQDLACLNIIDVSRTASDGGKFTVRTVNMTAYDPVKAELHLLSMERAAFAYRPPNV